MTRKHVSYLATVLVLLAGLPALAGGHATPASRCARLADAGRWKEARRTCRAEAEQGDPVAQYRLGLMYAEGRGVEKDPARAYRWIRRAADRGLADALFRLGVMYARGEGTPRSGAAAADRFYRAGLAYLADGRRDEALRCVEEIRRAVRNGDLDVPNDFLAGRLLSRLYPAEEKPGRQEKAGGKARKHH